jgi:pyruvate/2-oxoglutarate/acetoin dehydrogenase E1 component
MREDDSVVYFGEGVRHGGYHLVTAGVAFFFPKRIFAFPPAKRRYWELQRAFRKSVLH